MRSGYRTWASESITRSAAAGRLGRRTPLIHTGRVRRRNRQPKHAGMPRLVPVPAGPVQVGKPAGFDSGSTRSHRNRERANQPHPDTGRGHGKSTEHVGDLIPCTELCRQHGAQRRRQSSDVGVHLSGNLQARTGFCRPPQGFDLAASSYFANARRNSSGTSSRRYSRSFSNIWCTETPNSCSLFQSAPRSIRSHIARQAFW